MLWIFLSAFAIGGGLIIASLLGHDTDGGGHHTHTSDVVADAGLFAVFSLRNLTWASFAFGGIGTLAVLTQRSPLTIWASSATAGLLTLVGVHVLFRALQRGEGGENPLDVTAIGAQATLVLPFNDDGVGVVRFLANGQVQELPARRAPDAEQWDSSHFADCRIEYIADGMAIVRPA